MDNLGILNIYKLNIYPTVNLMFRVKNNTIQEAFQTKFQIVQHNYATRHSENPHVGLLSGINILTGV